MQVRARLNNFRMAPRKIRLAVDLIRGKNVIEAKAKLKFLNGKSGEPLFKLLNSSISNAVNNYGLDKNNLFVEKVKVDEGSGLKRWMPRAHGRAYPILKRSSHIEIILNEIEEGKNRKEVKVKKAKTVSYEELKKVMKEADKILEKQKGKKRESKNKLAGKAGISAKESAKPSSDKKGVISKIFRRKSI